MVTALGYGGSMANDSTTRQRSWTARLPPQGSESRRSLRMSDLNSLEPDDRRAVEYLLSLSVLDDD